MKRPSFSPDADFSGVGWLISVVSFLGITAIAAAGRAGGLDDGRRQMVGLVGQVPVHAADHRRVAVAHQLRQGCDVHAVDDAVGPKGVTDLVGAEVFPEAQFLAETLNLKANRVRRPLPPIAVDKDVIGFRPAPQEPHQPLHDRREMNHPRLAGLVHGFVLREHPTVFMHPVPGEFANFRRTSAGLPEGERNSLNGDAAARRRARNSSSLT